MSNKSYLLAAAAGLNLATRASRNFDYWYNKATKPTPARAITTMPYRRTQRRYRNRYTARGSNSGFNTGPRFRGSLPARNMRPQLKFSLNDGWANDFAANQEDNTRLVNIAAGDGPSQRDGRLIRVLNLRGQAVFPQGEDTRLIIYTPMNEGEVITLPTTGGSVDPTRFKVWYDNFWFANSDNRSIQFNLNFGKYGHKVHYEGQTVNDVTRGSIYMYQNQPGAAGTSRGHVITTFCDT